MSKVSASTPRLICLGRVIGVHGIRGEIKVQAEIDDLATLDAVAELWIGGALYRLAEGRFHKRHLLLRVEGVQTRQQAEELVGEPVLVERSCLPALPAWEYYWFEILGLMVYRADNGGYLGKVAAIVPTPAHDIYVVQKHESELLIPAVAEVIQAIDLTEGRLLVSSEGLAALSGAD
ncbi:ribosome maturation factor RimM [Desulfobacca acetoxidans]|uniref:Ribosome maturation factor RimM n=1 Tax=Desulfobacca acetoxidans (strain ATCC 700848 / DSM 11109 / ASRB2) TaxID=880072 RepID=F2NF69_DESAR|nr:ribosome maturation factor RimM [Desulfobacca acetoxidans]AEB08624.1 Ribosome maturation factor rimM [Desulfobacca acetoxidans DSM 11109]